MEIRNDLEIKNAIEQLKKQIVSKKFKKIPAEVQQGIKEAVRVLKDKDENLDHIKEHCSTPRARIIAWLAVDYMQKVCERKILLSVYEVEIKKIN